ncbi:ADP-ribose glycohydrolase OARD1-like [Ylistrum balloti]|uniref:ADP-ribose glycohydrolase OARD1-like n=1 Tax=Ylistrum balloti TaxID=509963 RepID=UPI002905E22F|nr:ADP-ribose glycohydrolase OARD1-like [Ylistrum balloti]
MLRISRSNIFFWSVYSLTKNMATASVSSGVNFKFRVVEGDLFSCPATDSLAHCISEDIRMGRGIAVLFKKKFKRVDKLKAMKKKTGELAVLNDGGRFIYYLITKPKANDKPTYDTLKSSLVEMKKHCVRNNVTSLSMPCIGCGLDCLNWEEVSTMICELFYDTEMTITVYQLPRKS